MTMQASTVHVVLRHCCHLARSQDLVTLLRLFRRGGAGPAGTGHTRSLPNSSTSEHLPTSLWSGRFPSTVFDLGKSRCHLILTDGHNHGSPTANPGNKTGRVGTLVGHRHPPLRVVGAVPTVLSGGGPVKTWSTTSTPVPHIVDIACVCGVERRPPKRDSWDALQERQVRYPWSTSYYPPLAILSMLPRYRCLPIPLTLRPT